MPTITSMGFAYGSIDDFGSGVFRKVRRELGVTAFGVNAMVLAPGTGWFEHFHEEQDELYFVHRGRAAFDVEGERFELGPGGVCHVESTTPRKFWNPGEETLVLMVVGGKVAMWAATATWSTPPTRSGGEPSAPVREAVIRRLPE